MTETEILRQQIEYLTNRNSKFVEFFLILSVVCIVAIVLLIVLNNRELKNKDKKLEDSQKYLQHIIKAQEEERHRISRELHDTVAQDMKYVNFLATRIEDQALSKEIQQNQRKCIDEIRDLCYNFAPIDIQNRDLPSALQNLIKSTQEKSNLNIRLTITDDVDFSVFNSDQLLYFYRIVQESISNILNHAQGTEATILFRQDINPNGKKVLKLFITDDGCGIEKNLLDLINSPQYLLVKNNQVHFGMRSIKERVALLNGTMNVESVVGEGTEIHIEIME